jgi:1-acyl-sn-glycerol-3-phosphate acyltransferase
MDPLWTVGVPVVRALMSIVFDIRVEGDRHVPRTGPAIIAPNHISVLDGPLLTVLTAHRRRRATRNLIAAEVFRGPVGWLLRTTAQLPISRGTGDSGALDAAIEALRNGSMVGIFPEGRVNEDASGGLQRIRSGLTRIAFPAGAPVVPVGLWGTHAIWPRGGLDRTALRRRRPFAVVYGEPLLPRPHEPPADFRERFEVALRTVLCRARSLASETT